MQATQPVFEIAKDDFKNPWHKHLLTITDTGRQVLTGKQDWLSLNPPGRWLGGVRIHTNQSCWRWDVKTGRLVVDNSKVV